MHYQGSKQGEAVLENHVGILVGQVKVCFDQAWMQRDRFDGWIAPREFGGKKDVRGLRSTVSRPRSGSGEFGCRCDDIDRGRWSHIERLGADSDDPYI